MRVHEHMYKARLQSHQILGKRANMRRDTHACPGPHVETLNLRTAHAMRVREEPAYGVDLATCPRPQSSSTTGLGFRVSGSRSGV
jgi:hypothetical protein